MIIVTGGAGFIGSMLLAGLEDRGLGGDLVLCDRLGGEDKWRNVARRELRDVVTPEGLLDHLDDHRDEIEVVFHLGANSSTTERDGDLIVAQNVRATIDIWEWCQYAGVRMIYASSAATYGDGSAGFDDDSTPEGLARLRPLNLYGWSKHVVDRRMARSGAFVPTEGAQTVGLKFFNVYGPNEYHKGGMRSVVAQVHPKAAAGEAARLFRSHRPDYEDGGQLRDFIWVGDCVDVMLWLLDHPEVSGLFNLGTGTARSFADLAASVYRALGREPMISYVDTPPEIRDKYQYFTEARMDRLRAAGYDRPFTTLEDGVARYVRDYLAQEDPYR